MATDDLAPYIVRSSAAMDGTDCSPVLVYQEDLHYVPFYCQEIMENTSIDNVS